MPDPKYPQDLSIISEYDAYSSPEEKEKEGWIMSTSKSFCGLNAALMAVDGKFGEKKMNASLMEVLNEARKSAANKYHEIEEDPNETIENLAKAKKEYAQRIDKITKYEEMIAAKGYGDVTMSELLSHRSGLEQKALFTPNPEFENDNFGFLKSDKVPYNPYNRGKVFSYNNPAFLLATELMGLASDSGDYYQELKTRVTDPLGMIHTKLVHESFEATKEPVETIYITDVAAEDWKNKTEAKDSSRKESLYLTQLGRATAGAGDLCSSISDLEIYSKALAETVCGIPNALTGSNPQKAREVHQSYLEAYHLGDNCTGKAASPDVAYAINHYSLGVFIGAVDDKGDQIPSRENKDKRLFIKHDGNMPGYDSKMKIIMHDVTFDDFENSRAAELSSFTPEVDLAIKKWDMLTRDSILTLVSHDYAKEMDEYFVSKSAKDSKYLNDNGRHYWQHIAVVRNEQISPKWQEDLITKGNLPSNFSEFHDEVRAAYETTKQILNDYLIKNYLRDDGIINSEAIKENFKDAEKFEEVQKMLEPHLQEARKTTSKILARADRQLEIEKLRATSNEIDSTKFSDLSFSSNVKAKEAEDAKTSKQSWVERVTEKGKARDDSQITSQDAVGAEELWADRVASKSAKDNSSHSLSS
ncbi:MAG: serine hydrolase [Rickettsiales bacterium]|nr:serine hydrolase [Rickettsiales bacterium]